MANHLDEAVLVPLLQQLIAIPSVNPSIAPEAATGEAAIAEFACDWLNAHGVRAWREEVAPGRPNVVGEIGSGARSLVWCAHLDTVGTAGMSMPFEPRQEAGRIYGRGAYDMKGSVAAIMAAAADLAQSPPDGRVLLALVVDEEYASIGADDFVRRHPADACILTEPSERRLILGHKGFVWAEIRTTGWAAHGSRWDLGISAIEKMAHIISALEAFDRTELRRRVHPLVGPASLHCALIEGGSGLSTYAAECTLKVERRTIPGETADGVERELSEIIRAAGEAAELRCFFDRQPSTCAADVGIASCVRSAVTQVTGEQPADAGVGYWMDAAIFTAAGIPAVNYGPGGAGAHETVEWVDAASVVTTARVLATSARLFLS